MPITHTTAADGTFSGTGATEWNRAHTIDNDTITEAQLSIADNTTKNVSITAHGFVPKAPNVATQFLNGTGAWSVPSVTLDGVAAAAADQAGIANADWNIRWNWAKVTNSEDAFTFGESAAATGGTSTSGVPNQVLLKLATLAASTMSPLSVYSRGSHVFSISPTLSQLLLTDGSSGAPSISWSASVTSGFYRSSSGVGLVIGGNNNSPFFLLSSAATIPTYASGVDITSGLRTLSAGVSVVVSSSQEILWNAGITQASHGSADAVAYAINSRKSRGTVASPTVITTGDDLLTISGYGYVGATNTYQEAARITFDSTGTISDSATGIGGIISFQHATVGAEPVTVAQMKSQHIVHSGTAPTITNGGGTGPTIAGTDESFVITIGTGGTATTVEVTFGNAFTTNAPSVAVTSDTDIVSFKITPLINKVTIDATLAFTAGSKLYCIARGWE